MQRRRCCREQTHASTQFCIFPSLSVCPDPSYPPPRPLSLISFLLKMLQHVIEPDKGDPNFRENGRRRLRTNATRPGHVHRERQRTRPGRVLSRFSHHEQNLYGAVFFSGTPPSTPKPSARESAKSDIFFLHPICLVAAPKCRCWKDRAQSIRLEDRIPIRSGLTQSTPSDIC
eukprot:gene10730-biopygen4801